MSIKSLSEKVFPRTFAKSGLKHNAAKNIFCRKNRVHTFFRKIWTEKCVSNFVNGKNPLKNPLNIFYFLQCKYDNDIARMWKILAPTRVCQ